LEQTVRSPQLSQKIHKKPLRILWVILLKLTSHYARGSKISRVTQVNFVQKCNDNSFLVMLSLKKSNGSFFVNHFY